MNMLFCPESLQLRHPDFAKAYDLVDNDIQTLLGTQKSYKKCFKNFYYVVQCKNGILC